jgi:hypothetical protein
MNRLLTSADESRKMLGCVAEHVSPAGKKTLLWERFWLRQVKTEKARRAETYQPGAVVVKVVVTLCWG